MYAGQWESQRWLAIVLLAACGGSDSSSGKGPYEARVDCEHILSCWESVEGFAAGTLMDCTESSRESYRGLEPMDRTRLDSAYGTCKHLASCEYLDCFDAELGVGAGSNGGDGGDGGTCEANFMPATGEVQSAAWALPYSSVDASFWVNQADCLTALEVQFASAGCVLTLGGKGLLDPDGRYLITYASFEKSGPCPDYPDSFSGDYAYSVDATAEALGTLTLTRDDVGWDQCTAGGLLVEPKLVLKGTADEPEIDLSRAKVLVQGNFRATYLDALSGCPAVAE